METSIRPKSNQEFQFGEGIIIKTVSKDNPFTIISDRERDTLEWAEKHKDEINNLLLEHGAILLRGFKIDSPKNFNELFSTISGQAIEYKNRTSPRDQVYSNVYTSTSHPKSETIHMHTENSYSNIYNRIIAFYCLLPAQIGGETPIADERKLLASLKKETVEEFKKKGIQYVRNTIPGIGLSWQTIYQTEDKEEVAKILKNNGHDFTWVNSDHLRIKWTLPAFQDHPVTGEEMWFNHMFFGHKELYDPSVLEYFDEEDLPFATYYGDGSEIGAEVIEEFKNFYKEHSIVYTWEKDDFLLLDNLMFSHGRKPFKGDRTILTAMGQPQDMKL
ncbi:Taurine dioxygenase, alpha-ketoglutarate-dependent [Flavobacterium sp. CF108]|uniref:TauD/TfdA family dioxygenase n=1 Tax=unclassified Flavobacterium TaxID=196869 RepID=UPI0008AFBE11|nr:MULTISPECIES: TauD/TfdA family dioxygenase [unclassified Flavobacterium]SEO95073.1 Taurine dioxygenase, alpha-ketoglutarate-dependent [Flavobacterium sp. fv08]SHH82298.1 Taurine dioxygenase, alpha-ketoglutarate-dependent [Flavobacterium sp. CF108]